MTVRRSRILVSAAILVAAFPGAAVSRPLAKAVYKVPGTIKGDCSVAVETKLMAWLSTVPDGSTVQFGPGRCYGQDGTITITGRNHLVIDGQGSEFRGLTPGGSHRANWRFVNGSDLTIRNMAVRGSNPQGLYDPAVEWQHGFAVEGVQGMTLSNVQVRETWGDGVDLYRGGPSPACGDDASSARNILITDALLERIGRQGMAIVDAEQVTLQDSTIGPVAWADVDIETDDDCDIARHITLARNSLGANNYGAIVSVGFGGNPQVGDLTATDNTQTAPTGAVGSVDECRSPVRILSPAGRYRYGYTFTRNHLLARRNAFAFRGVQDVDRGGQSVDVSSNSATFTPTDTCGATAGVNLLDSHIVNIENNVFTGAAAVFTADGASTGITSTGNTLN